MPHSFNVVTIEGGAIQVELVKFHVNGDHETTLVARAPVSRRWGGTEESHVASVLEGGLQAEGPNTHVERGA